jgi:hypothetical protein
MHALLVLLLVLLISGCPLQDEPSPPPTFPRAEGISRLAVSKGVQLTERSSIDRFVEALSPLQSGWGYTWHTYPTPQASVFFVGPGEVPLCRVDLGPNWLGSDCGQLKSGAKWPPYVHLSPAQARWFRDAVGGKWEVK